MRWMLAAATGLALGGCAEHLEPSQQDDVQGYFEELSRSVDDGESGEEGDAKGLCLCTLYENGVAIARTWYAVPPGRACSDLDWHNPPYEQVCL